jgi:hypothetical protein
MTTVEDGPGAGVYVVGQAASNHWTVRKGINGGTTWTTVDDFVMDPNGLTFAEAVTSDTAGNLYVAGEASKRTLVGMTKQKQPIYSYSYAWIVRKSIDGGSSWFTDADLPTADFVNEAFNMGSDAAGNVYAVSPGSDALGSHSIIRSNTGGSWQTVDDFQLSPGQHAYGYGFAAAPDGTLYAAGCAADASGTYHGFVRALAPMATTATTFAMFSSESVVGAGHDGLELDFAEDDILVSR